MPITDSQAAQLAAEALEHTTRPTPKPVDMTQASDRLRVASLMLGTALDALEKHLIVCKNAKDLFLAEWAAAIQSGVTPAGLVQTANAASERMMRASRPKTFGTQPEDDSNAGNGK